MRRKNEKKKQNQLRKIGLMIWFINFMVIIVGIIGRIGYWDLHYKMDCEVVKIVDDVVTLEDSVGYLWEVEDTTLELGETYTVVFFNNDTDTRIDDEVEKIKIEVDK